MLTLTELKSEAEETYKGRTLQDWKDASDYRGITRRSQRDFDALIPMYVKKIGNIREQLRSDWSVTLIPIVDDKLKTPQEMGDELTEQLQYYLEKETRLIDKFAACVKEVQMRKDGDVIRTDLHDQAVYYIDYGQADDTGDGLTTGNAYKTITKYTTTEIRTAGDIAYLRANVTWTQGTEAVDITLDEDGDQDDYIKIIGCDSVTNDPWGDGSDVLPIIDFENQAYQFKTAINNFWWIERLNFTNGNDSNGLFYFYISNNFYIKDCVFRDGNTNSIEGVYAYASGILTLDGCSFSNTNGISVEIKQGNVFITGCTIDAGAVDGATFGVRVSGGTSHIEDSTIAGVNAFTTAAVIAGNGGLVYMRNVTFGTEDITVSDSGSVIYIEDHDGTFESHKTQYSNGIITRDTGTTRVGGANSSAKMESNANCGPNRPLILGNRLSGFARIWATKDVEIDLTVYAAVGSAWDSALTAAECYAKFSYLNHAVNATRTEVDSTEQIANDTTWTALTSGNFTPLQTGWVYVWLYLEEYEDDTEHIFVDLKVA